MTGHLVKRYGETDSWSLVVNTGLDPETGKYRQRWFTFRGTEKRAQKRLDELIMQFEDSGVLMKAGKVTVADFLKRWLSDFVGPNLGPRTAEGYESIIREHLIPKLGALRLAQLRPEHIQRYYADMLAGGRSDGAGGLSPRSVRHHHEALHNALQTAVKWGILQRNCADAVDPPPCQRHEMQTLDEAGAARLLEASRSTPYYAIFYVALYTGMRRSEILALRWADIDLVMGRLSVTRSLHQLLDKSIVYRPPKTAKGRRTIALTPSTTAVLRAHRAEQEATRSALDMPAPAQNDDLVFCQYDGRPFLPDSVSRAWYRVTKSLGLEARFHDARHTHASLLLRQGVHPKIVQERLGHSSIQITLDTYSHVAPGLQEAAALRFDQGMGNVAMPKDAVREI